MNGADGSNGERFLVTGALGCIGAWTVRQLVARGRRRWWASTSGRDPRRLAQIMSPTSSTASTSWRATSRTSRALERALDEHGITNVIHLAALQVPFCRADPPLGAGST